MKSQIWTKPFRDRRLFIGGSDGRTIIRADETALMHQWSERRELAEPEQLSDNQPRDRANAEPSTRPVQAAHAEFVAALKGQPPRAIQLDVDAADLEVRADHLKKVLNALSIYVTAILDDTAQNVPGGLNFGDVGAGLSDLASDVTGTIQLAADAMTGRIA